MKFISILFLILTTNVFAQDGEDKSIINRAEGQNFNLGITKVGGAVEYPLIIDGGTGEVKQKGLLSAPASGDRGEYKEITTSSQTDTVSAGTYIDVNGQSLSLEPGVWLIGYDNIIRFADQVGGVNAVYGGFVITDSTNTSVLNTVGTVSAEVDNALGFDNYVFSVSRQTRIIVSSTETYKVRMRCSQANTSVVCTTFSNSFTGALGDPDNNSVFWALRL